MTGSVVFGAENEGDIMQVELECPDCLFEGTVSARVTGLGADAVVQRTCPACGYDTECLGHEL